MARVVAQRIERPSVQAGYDLWAESYDETPNPIVAADRLYTPMLLTPRPQELVLDTGCGTGGHVTSMANAGARTIGIDFSHGMLKVTRRRAT